MTAFKYTWKIRRNYLFSGVVFASIAVYFLRGEGYGFGFYSSSVASFFCLLSFVVLASTSYLKVTSDRIQVTRNLFVSDSADIACISKIMKSPTTLVITAERQNAVVVHLSMIEGEGDRLLSLLQHITPISCKRGC